MLAHVFLSAVLTGFSCCPAEELSVEQILDNIEAVDFNSFSAVVLYTRIDPILERREIRTGRVLIRMDEEKKREAAILFDTLIIGNRKEEYKKHYIFSGRWMAEVDHDKKQFIKRELLSPTADRDVDPFELGNGPVPLPIGQSKESVLKQYEVTLTTPPNDGSLSKLADEPVIGLHLVPINTSEWESIELFYDPKTWLPIGVRTVETDGTIREHRLTQLQVNSMTEEDAELLSIETPDPKVWSIDIRPWSNN